MQQERDIPDCFREISDAQSFIQDFSATWLHEKNFMQSELSKCNSLFYHNFLPTSVTNGNRCSIDEWIIQTPLRRNLSEHTGRQNLEWTIFGKSEERPAKNSTTAWARYKAVTSGAAKRSITRPSLTSNVWWRHNQNPALCWPPLTAVDQHCAKVQPRHSMSHCSPIPCSYQIRREHFTWGSPDHHSQWWTHLEHYTPPRCTHNSSTGEY